MDIKLTLLDLLGTNRYITILGVGSLVIVLLAFLPDLTSTFDPLLGLLPFKESVIADVKKALLTSKNWSPVTRRVLGLLGVVILIFDGWVFFASTPQAIGEDRSIPQGASLSVNVLDNERDARQIKLSLASYDKRSDRGGTITCEGPVCTYVPPASFSGDDNFYYEVNFEGRGMAGAKVLIHVLQSTQTPLPPPTQTPAPTLAPTFTSTPSPTPTLPNTFTPTAAPSFTPTGTPALTFTPTPIVTPPTATPTIASSATPTPTTTPTATPTFSATTPPSENGEPYLTTNGRVFVRPWPKREGGYGYVTILEDGTRVRILGRSGAESDYYWWWLIECPQDYPSTTGCWVTSNPDIVNAHNTGSVPFVPDPPTPTPKG
jgi:hypothetical protein